MALAFYSDTILINNSGRAYPGVRVIPMIGGVAQPIYADAGGTPLSQAITNDNGQFQFWVETGTYDLYYSVNGASLGPPQTGVEIYDLLRDGAGIVPLSVVAAYARGTSGWKAVQQVHLDDLAFGGPANEADDSSAAVVAAAARLTEITGGGIIRITGRRRIDASVTLPDGVVLQGESAQHGSIYPSSDGNRGATLIVAAAATILCRNASGARNLMVERAGLTYGITSTQVASTFAGVAFTLATNTSDHVFENMDILGFQYAIKSQDTATVGPTAQNNRTRIENVRGDNLNGIWIHNAYDVPYIGRVHLWPYVTADSTGEAGSAQLKRSGAAFKLTGTNDWTKISNSFSFGYAIGAQVTDGRSITFLNVSHDHPPGSTDGSRGYFFEGGCAEICVIGGRVAGKEYGAHVYSTNAVGRAAALFSSVGIWKTTTQAIRIQGGTVQVNGGFIRNDPDTIPNGIGIKNENTGSAEVSVIGVDFAGLATAIENQAATSILRYRDCTFRACNVQITNAYMPSIASSATIAPNGVDAVFNLTGTTNVGSISSPQRYTGKMVTFIVVSGLSFLTGGNIILRTGANTPVAAGLTISFVSDGTNWREV